VILSRLIGSDGKKSKTKRVSVADRGGEGSDNSANPVISSDGRFIAFASAAEDLVGSDAKVKADVFLRGPLR
jgi:hypothetical protein